MWWAVTAFAAGRAVATAVGFARSAVRVDRLGSRPLRMPDCLPAPPSPTAQPDTICELRRREQRSSTSSVSPQRSAGGNDRAGFIASWSTHSGGSARRAGIANAHRWPGQSSGGQSLLEPLDDQHASG